MTIIPVNNKKLLTQFIDFPHELYKNDACYVPELFMAQKDLLNPAKHPFYEHAEVALFLCLKDDKIVGRIAAILNHNHNHFNHSTDGFFGFFDCIDDEKVAQVLLNEASKWLKSKGANSMMGPVNFSTNESTGLLIEGFGSPPVAMMTYNKPYYLNLLERQGFSKKIDLLAYQLRASSMTDKALRLNAVLQTRLRNQGINIRKINLKKYKEETDQLQEIYNAAWDKNLGFVPMTKNEFNYLAKDLKQIIDPDFCIIAEKEGKVIGFSLAIPDINQVLIKIKKGRLFPTGILKLAFQRRKIDAVRIIALGVVKEHRKKGIEACFYGETMSSGSQKGIFKAEASWVLEHNDLMNKALIEMGGTVYKRYRILEKVI
jgi:GNAT superfamily N-acetyltransferase